MRKLISNCSLSTRVGRGLMGFVLTLVVIIMLVSCGKDILPEPVVTSPTIVTTEVASVTTTSVISGGNISSDGGAKITDRGVCWGLTNNPSINDNKSAAGSGTGIFSSTLSGLIPGTSYHARAYAVTSLGTFYGNDVTFTTSQIMRTVKISSGSGGKVTPSGTVSLADGSFVEVTIISDYGYKPNEVTQNGSSSKQTTSIFRSKVEGADMDINFSFRKDPALILYDAKRVWKLDSIYIYEPRYSFPGDTLKVWKKYASTADQTDTFNANGKSQMYLKGSPVGDPTDWSLNDLVSPFLLSWNNGVWIVEAWTDKKIVLVRDNIKNIFILSE